MPTEFPVCFQVSAHPLRPQVMGSSPGEERLFLIFIPGVLHRKQASFVSKREGGEC